GKGVYVRTLAVDTAKLLGVSGHMSDLTRTQSAGFTQEQAVSLKQVEKAVQKNCLAEIILPIEYGVQMFKRVDIDEQLWQKVRNGMRLSYESFDLREMPQETIALFYQNQVVSLYQPNLKEAGQLKPLKVLKT
ncbi:MAG TPA: tRNA pseudouridine(55) synthase TruB, partial [Tetragenococcus sp.]|nr:tRNA pseudouridine(55) synthase TruB [Tetragenococcus sp.]